MTEKPSGYNTEHVEQHANKKRQSSRINIRYQGRSPLFYVLRLLIVASVQLFFFGFICRPGIISGASMEPTYPSSGFLFHSPLLLKLTELKRGDIVTVRYGSHRVMLLKRVIAFEGETIEFRKGVCYIDGIELKEDYVQKPCRWNLPPKIVQEGHVYVLGDNRSMDPESHVFGQVKLELLQGKALW